MSANRALPTSVASSKCRTAFFPPRADPRKDVLKNSFGHEREANAPRLWGRGVSTAEHQRSPLGPTYAGKLPGKACSIAARFAALTTGCTSTPLALPIARSAGSAGRVPSAPTRARARLFAVGAPSGLAAPLADFPLAFPACRRAVSTWLTAEIMSLKALEGAVTAPTAAPKGPVCAPP
eukprot:2198162-Lingulodinium_polyedra.AAC.1